MHARLHGARLLTVWLTLAVSAPGLVRADVIDRVLAVVDGRLVTLSDVRVALVLGLVPASGPDALEEALDRRIDRILVLQEVERFAPPEPDAAVIDVRLADVLSRLGTAEVRTPRLSALGVDETWLRQWVRDDLRIQSYIEQRFTGALEPTSEELENYFREHRSEFEQDGRELNSTDAQAIARAGVMAARRAALVTEWLQGLRRRAEISRPAAR